MSETLDYLRRAIENAPRQPLTPTTPAIFGWTVNDGELFVCANCAGRIMDRGCHLPGSSAPVWAVEVGDDEPRCCLCQPQATNTYKVWVHVEEIDEDGDSYEDIGLPDSIGEFNTIEEAESLVSELLERYAPEMMATSDHT